MKAIYIALACTLFFSCASSNKVTRATKKSIDGVWILNEVNYNNKGTYDIAILDNILSKCVEDTNWEFISNNNTGSYALSGSSCSDKGIYNFIWSIPEEKSGSRHSIMLKLVNQKVNTKGYRMQLYQLETNKMTWSYDTVVDNEEFTIKLDFSKA